MNDPSSFFSLSMYYSDGHSGKVDLEKAFRYCLKSAELDYKEAMQYVGKKKIIFCFFLI